MRQTNLTKQKYAIEQILTSVEQSGCYFMSLLYAAFGREPTLGEIIDSYNYFTEIGIMGKDCYIKDPVKILNNYSELDWRVISTNIYDPNADLAIAYYYNPNTNLHHFVLMKDENTVLFDPIPNSKTVAEGYVESWRLFYL